MSKMNNEKSVIDILKSKSRFRIFSLLHLYPELSLSELSTKMRKSKSTIHHHLQELIDYDIIEVSHKEKVRGSILAKYYSLKPGYIEKLAHTDSELDKVTSSTFEFFKTYLDFVLRTIEIYKKFFEVVEKREGGFEYLKDLFKRDEGFSSLFFLSKDQFKKVRILYNDFCKEINKIEAEENGLKKEKPFFVLTLGVPLKEVIEEIAKKPPPPPKPPKPPKAPSPPPKK